MSNSPLRSQWFVIIFLAVPMFGIGNLHAGLISTIAGTGTDGFSGDGGAATSAQLYPENECFRVAVDPDGDVYIADVTNHRVRKISISNGTISTVAGDGSAGFSGDDGDATLASLDRPTNIAFDNTGNMYILDSGNNRVRKVVLSTGIITTVAGPGGLNDPRGIAVDPSGVVYITDTNGDGSLKKVVDGQPNNLVTAISGGGSTNDLVIDSSGNIYITDSGNGIIRKVDPSDYSTTDLTTNLYEPRAISVGPNGYLYVAEIYNHRILKIDSSTGLFVTIAGGNGGGFHGDGGQAMSARLNEPTGIAVDDWGNLFIADTENSRVRMLSIFEATDQTSSANEDVVQSITLVGSHSGGDLTYSVVSDPSNGNVSLSGNTATYTPSLNWNGSDSFTWQLLDGIIGSTVGTVSITVDPVNDAPTATAQSVSGDEDTVQTITLSGSDPDGDNLIYMFSSYPSDGTVSLNGRTVTYTPDLDFNGSDSFSFYVSDGNLSSSNETVSITVNPVNDIPTATSQSVSVVRDSIQIIHLLARDPDGDDLAYTLVQNTNPANGRVFNGGDSIATFVPTSNFTGNEHFYFNVSDGILTSSPAIVSISVSRANNHAPTANALSVSVNEDIPQTIVLSGDDSDGDSLAFTLLSNPSYGNVSLNGNVVTYTSELNYNGFDSFDFTTSDGIFTSQPATVSITVIGVNDAPDAIALSSSGSEDKSQTIILSGDDPEGDDKSYVIFSQPSNGTVNLIGNTAIYTPLPNFFGSDNFSYGVSDGSLSSSSAMVSINVVSVNDAPHANSEYVKGYENTPHLIVLSGNDPDGDNLIYGILSNPQNGRVSLSDSTLIYTPYPNYVGSDSFKFTVSDGSITSDAAFVTIEVSKSNTAPTLFPIEDQFILVGDQLSLLLVANDVDGDTLSYFFSRNPIGSTLSGNRFDWVPSADQIGTFPVEFVVSDGNGGSVSKMISIIVNPLEDVTKDRSKLPEGPFTLDFDTIIGDQGKRTQFGVKAGDVQTMQIYCRGLPDINGWSTTMKYDSGQVRMVKNSFVEGSFLPGAVMLSSDRDGVFGIGGSLLGDSHSASGDGFLGEVNVEILDGFTGSTEVYISEIILRLSDGGRLKKQVYHKVEFNAEVPFSKIVGDFDYNGYVDFNDFFMFADAFGGTHVEYDLDGSGEIDFLDFFVFAENFGQKEDVPKLVALAEQMIGLPARALIYPNYPNPFNTETTIPYRVASPSNVIIEVYDISGQKIKKLVDGFHNSGQYRVRWDGRNERFMGVSSGVYFLSMNSMGKISTRKIVLTK